MSTTLISAELEQQAVSLENADDVQGYFIPIGLAIMAFSTGFAAGFAGTMAVKPLPPILDSSRTVSPGNGGMA